MRTGVLKRKAAARRPAEEGAGCLVNTFDVLEVREAQNDEPGKLAAAVVIPKESEESGGRQQAQSTLHVYCVANEKALRARDGPVPARRACENRQAWRPERRVDAAARGAGRRRQVEPRGVLEGAEAAGLRLGGDDGARVAHGGLGDVRAAGPSGHRGARVRPVGRRLLGGDDRRAGVGVLGQGVPGVPRGGGGGGGGRRAGGPVRSGCPGLAQCAERDGGREPRAQVRGAPAALQVLRGAGGPRAQRQRERRVRAEPPGHGAAGADSAAAVGAAVRVHAQDGGGHALRARHDAADEGRAAGQLPDEQVDHEGLPQRERGGLGRALRGHTGGAGGGGAAEVPAALRAQRRDRPRAERRAAPHAERPVPQGPQRRGGRQHDRARGAFVPRAGEREEAASKQGVEEAILERVRSRADVVGVEWLYDGEWFVVLVLYGTGHIESYRAFSGNHALRSNTRLVVPDVARVHAVRALRREDRTLLAMFLVDDAGETRLSLYCWSASALALEASWVFCAVPEGEELIGRFDVWYEGGPMYLVTPCVLASSGMAGGATHVYLIKDADIAHWMVIEDGEVEDLFTGSRRVLAPEARGARYSLAGDKLVCHLGDERVVPLTLASGTEASGGELPVYHPQYVEVLLALGLRKFVDELVWILVEACREFLAKLSESGTCGSSNPLQCPCDCLMLKVEHVEIFTEFNRNAALYLLQTFAGLINADAGELFGEAVRGHVSIVSLKEGVPLDELLLYLQHMRLPGLVWKDQIGLMRLLGKLRPKAGAERFVDASVCYTKSVCGMDTLSNFLLYSATHASREAGEDEPIDFRLSTELEAPAQDAYDGGASACPLTRRAQNLLKDGKEEKRIQVYRTNDRLCSLTLPPRPLTGEFCLGRCLDYVKYGCDDEDYLVWAVFYKDDLHLLSSVLGMLGTADDLAVCEHLLHLMKRIGVGYWVQTPACVEQFCATLERGFRRLIATTESGCSAETFDEFGFWSILRGKPLVYGCVLKAKGFQRLGEFLSNDFSAERWINAAVKNAYALIAQKRYLLAAGFLLLAGQVRDAVDVCFQYMDDPQLGCLICRVRQFDLGYAVERMKPSRVKDVLRYREGARGALPVEAATVEQLVYFLYTGMRFKHVAEERMAESVARCAAEYRAKGMPLAALMLASLVRAGDSGAWQRQVVGAGLCYLTGGAVDRAAGYQECLRIMQDLCKEDIRKDASNLSNYGSEPDGVGHVFSDAVSDIETQFSGPVVIFSDEPEAQSVKRLGVDGFHLYIINLLNGIKARYGLEVALGFGAEGLALEWAAFEAVARLPDYFAHLSKLCIGFFEEETAIDGSTVLALILRALEEARDDLVSCLVLATASLLAICCFDRGVTGQIYDALLGQLVVLNNLLNSQGSGSQFMACLLRTVEPLCFGAPGRALEPQCVNVLQCIDNGQKHAFFGLCLGTAVLEALLGVCRSWLYRFAEQADPVAQAWVDRLLFAAARALFRQVRRELVEEALNATGIVFPMLSLRIGLERPVDCQVEDEECHVYDTFLEQYVASVYGSEFEKLWRLLDCGFRTASIFSRSVPPARPCGLRARASCCRAMDVDGHAEPSAEDTRGLPLVIPLTAMFATPQAWNQEYVAALSDRVKGGGHERGHAGEIAVLDALRMLRFRTLHAFKGRLASPMYSMRSMTICEELKGMATATLVGPVLSDLYLMAMLNLRGSGRLSSLAEEAAETVASEVSGALNGTRPAARSYALFVKLVRLMATYCRNHLEIAYAMKKTSRFTALAERIYKCFHVCGDSKEHGAGGPSGGICGHPQWPIYAVVYGENAPGQIPAYTVSLQHPVTLMRGYRSAVDGAGHACADGLVYDNLTGMRLNVGQGSVFGDLCSVAWLGDSLSVLNKSGWLLVYYMKHMLYLDGDEAEVAIPAVSFRAHTSASEASWLSDSYIATIGAGVAQEMVSPQVAVIDTKQEEVGYRSSSSLSKASSSLQYDTLESLGSNRSDADQLVRGVTESQVPCVCIWDLVDFGKNNSPKLRALLANSANVPHSVFNKKKHVASVRFTCMLPIPALAAGAGRGASAVEHDLVIFDSLGSMMLFSAATCEIAATYHVHSSAVVKCFYVGGSIVTVAQDGAVAMFRLNGVFAEPTRVFEGVARPRVGSADVGSGGTLVASIGEYLGIKLVQSSSRGGGAGGSLVFPEIVDAQVVQNRFLVLTTADGAATVTELPC
ncbi:DmX-like protein 2 [Babesia caballi]|uniref:DmX-like protein 2 n=1 Tax=Babesia caballi TaxID=5871 RepID=A0AAV4LX67_BABCB|nr:DmX-like protein 2 [Babesia caballi]